MKFSLTSLWAHWLLLTLWLGLLGFTACSATIQQSERSGPRRGPLQESYFINHPKEDLGPFYEKALGVTSLFPIDDKVPLDKFVVVLERSRCDYGCRAFTLELSGNGTARLWGAENIQNLGCHSADLDLRLLSQIYAVGEAIDFFSMDPAFILVETDVKSTFLRLSLPEREHTVWHWGEGPPIQLWLFEWLIDHIGQDLSWRPAEGLQTPEDCLETL